MRDHNVVEGRKDGALVGEDAHKGRNFEEEAGDVVLTVHWSARATRTQLLHGQNIL